jgi:hypothetical protein
MTDVQAITFDSEVDRMNDRERSKFLAASERSQSRNLPLKAKVETTEAGELLVSAAGDPTIYAVQLAAALGTNAKVFMNLAAETLCALWHGKPEIIEDRFNAALAVLEGAKPNNEIQAMLVIQMIAAHDRAMDCAGLMGAAKTESSRQALGHLANEFMATFVSQVEALTKLRAR